MAGCQPGADRGHVGEGAIVGVGRAEQSRHQWAKVIDSQEAYNVESVFLALSGFLAFLGVNFILGVQNIRLDENFVFG